jgi:hypothetical protein
MFLRVLTPVFCSGELLNNLHRATYLGKMIKKNSTHRKKQQKFQLLFHLNQSQNLFLNVDICTQRLDHPWAPGRSSDSSELSG